MVERRACQVGCIGQPVAGKAQVEERSGPVIDSPVPSPSTPGDAGDVEDVVPVPGSIFNDEEVVTSEPVFDDAMGDVGPSAFWCACIA